jgi:hypothetical protein
MTEKREELKNQDLQRGTTCESEACVRKPFVLPAGCPVITPPVIPTVTFCETPTLATVPDSPIDLGLTLDCPVPKLKLSGPICGTFSTNPKDSCRATLRLKVPRISITGDCAVDVHKTPAGHRPGDCDNVEYKISVKKFSLKPIVKTDCRKDPTAYIVTKEEACEVKNELHINIPNPHLSVNVVPVCGSEPTGTLEATGCENILRLEIPRPRELGLEIEPTCGAVSPSGYWDFGEGGKRKDSAEDKCRATLKLRIPQPPELSVDIVQECDREEPSGYWDFGEDSTQEDSAEDKCRATLKLRIPQPPELSVDIVQECDREEPSGEVVDPEEVSFDSTESGCRKTIKLRIPKTPTPLLLMTQACSDEDARIYTCTDGRGEPIRLAEGTAACDICKPAYLLKIPKPPVWRSIIAVTEDEDRDCCTQHTGGTWECCTIRKPEVTMTFLTDTAVEVPKNATGGDGRPSNCGGVIKSIIKIPKQCKPTFMGTFYTGDDQHGYMPPKIEVSSEATSENKHCIRIVKFNIPAPPPPVTMTCEATGDEFSVTRELISFDGHPALQWKFRISALFENISCIAWLVKAQKLDNCRFAIRMCTGYIMALETGVVTPVPLSPLQVSTSSSGYVYYTYDTNGAATTRYPARAYFASSLPDPSGSQAVVCIAYISIANCKITIEQRHLGTLVVLKSVCEVY